MAWRRDTTVEGEGHGSSVRGEGLQRLLESKGFQQRKGSQRLRQLGKGVGVDIHYWAHYLIA